ncbi:hypothetical protein FKP32DRAFT_1671419 [Trametes sanguinea]|nr:hypothetical protein FKP32DRAFT_1675058 [Trametes sanguinea]KAI9069363.1 hypothetical protein FKP32DRAFT_1671419 [Trametes sanguinea]
MSISYGNPVNIVARPIAPRERRSAPSQTREQRLEAAATRRVREEQIDKEIMAWYDATQALAKDLSNRFPGKKADYYLNIMFSGALKQGKTREPSAFNAWLHLRAKENADGSVNIAQLSDNDLEEYHQLSQEEKQALKAELMEERNSRQFGVRLDQRGRTQDVSHVCNKIEEMLTGLQSRAGVEAFYCVVRNTPDFSLKPRWWFSSAPLDEFLRGTIRGFQPERIGVLAEAFAIAGPDYLSHLKNTEQKAAFLKSEIRDLVGDALVQASGDTAATMSYVNFRRDIELRYGITIDGWCHTQFCTPSKMSSAIAPLEALRDALRDGTCKFVPLTHAKKLELQREYDDLQASGAQPKRKQRSDAGKKRKAKSSGSSATSKKARVDNAENVENIATE